VITQGSARRLIVFGVIFFFAILIVILFLWNIREILILTFLSLMLAAAMRRPALWVSRWIGWGAAVVLVHFALLLAMAGLAFLFVPTIVSQALLLIESVPLYAQQARALGDAITAAMTSLGLATSLPIQSQQFTGFLVGLLEQAIVVPVNLAIGVAALFTIVALSLYWLLDRERLLGLALSFVPAARQRVARRIVEEVESNLGAYVWGQAVVSLIVGMLTLVGLLVLGVRFAFLLAVFAAMMEVIPTLGPFIAGAPAVLVAFSQSFWQGVAVLVLYVVVQELEAYLIAPKVQEAAVSLSPFMILFAILVGGVLWGIVGALIAVPVAVTLGVVLAASRPSLLALGEAFIESVEPRREEPPSQTPPSKEG